MAITNGYCTLADITAELPITSGTTTYDSKLETAVEAASRQIDGFCGRRFWQDSTLITRTYFADSPTECHVDDISTSTGLVVTVDDGDDGTFSTTLTITTNFILLPVNAGYESPVWPYTAIRIVDSGASRFPVYTSGRPGVSVTAKFGWPAVPTDVKKACIIQAVQLFKSSEAAFGGLNFDGSVFRVRDSLNPMAAQLLEKYVKYT